MTIKLRNSKIIYNKFSVESCKNAFFVIDLKVDQIYQISQTLPIQKVLIIRSGEKAKSFSSFCRIIKFFADNEISKNDEIVAVGGGSLLDLVGFATSIYKRGLPVNFVPTTLLSMADAAIGGKNAINYQTYKNLLGTIYLPYSITIDHNFLKTLPRKHLISGYFEILKVSMLKSSEFFFDLINDSSISFNNKYLKNIVKTSIDFKLSIINNDLYDNNLRKILNFGHTIGHAIELNYNLTHGLSVGYGMKYALLLSEKYLGLSNYISTAYINHISNLKINFMHNFDSELIIRNLKFDKKSFGDYIEIILLEDIGKPVIYQIKYEHFINDIQNLLKS